MRVLRSIVPYVSVFATLAWLSACSDSNSSGSGSKADPAAATGLASGQFNTFTDIDTSLSETKVAAGTDVKVTCTATPGSVVVPKPTFSLLPADGISFTGDTIKTSKAGSYTVACTLANSHKLVDTTPVILTVVAGPAKEITATVNPAKVAAGATAQVTCSGKDAFGNVLGKDDQQFSAVTTPPELGAVDAALVVTGKKAGKGDVRCQVPNMPSDTNVVPANFEVIAGKPTKTVATVNPGEITAGDSGASVTCEAQDAYGNKVDTSDFTIDPPVGTSLQGSKVVSTKAGSYDIKCGLAGVTDNTAAKLTVKAAASVAWSLGISPDKKIYAQGDTVKTMANEEDQYGNVTPVWVKSGVAVDPPSAVTVNGGGASYDLNQDGNVTFTYTHPALKTKAGSAQDSKTIKVDSTGPLVYFSSPKRGETRDGDANVAIKGTAADEMSAFKSLTINKNAVIVAKDGSFSLTQVSKPGMNPIVWEAEDEWGNKSNGVQTWYYSTKWYPNDTTKPEDARVTSGIGFWMAQSTVDAGPPHNHTTPKDLASVAEIIIGTLDLKSLLGAAAFPINQGISGIFTIKDIAIKSVTFGDKTKNDGYPEFSFTIIKGGLHIAAKIYNLNVLLQLNVDTFGTSGWQEFVATSDWITFESDLMMSLDPVTKKPLTSLANTKIKMQSFVIKLGGNSLPKPLDTLVSGAINLLIDTVNQWVGSTLTGLIEGILQDQIQQQLGGALGSAFQALAINTKLPMKPFIGTGESVDLALNSALGLLDFKAAEGILVGLDASMTAPKKVEHAVLGSFGRAACLQSGAKDVFNPALKYALEVGLADDFVNELLHALWNGGLLQLKIGAADLGSVDLSSYGIKDLSVDTDFWLQPVVNTCVAANGQLELQVGDLGVHAKLTMGGKPVDVYMFASLSATAELSAVADPATGGKKIGFALKAVDFLELEVTQINAEAKGLKNLFGTLIKTVLVPKLLGSLGSGLGSFPLPELDLSALSPAIPAGTKLAIDVQQIDNTGGYTYLRGKVK